MGDGRCVVYYQLCNALFISRGASRHSAIACAHPNICVRMCMCFWWDVYSCGAGRARLYESRIGSGRWVPFKDVDNFWLHVWFIYRVCMLNVFAHSLTVKQNFFWAARLAFENGSCFLPPGSVGGGPWDGSQQVSPHALGHPVQRRQCQGKLRPLLFPLIWHFHRYFLPFFWLSTFKLATCGFSVHKCTGMSSVNVVECIFGCSVDVMACLSVGQSVCRPSCLLQTEIYQQLLKGPMISAITES